MILDEQTLRKINALTLVATQIRAGVFKGDRRSSKRGTSIEFADYRDYVPGDDLRRVDWNVYARLDKPYIKLFEEEEDLSVHILIDASKSMDWGKGEARKFSYAIHLAAALGSITLSKGDQLNIALMQSDKITANLVSTRGTQQTMRVFSFLEKQHPKGRTELNKALKAYTRKVRQPGLVFLISDLLDPNGCESGLSKLQSQGHEISILHLLSPDEIDPPLAGDLRLIDSESGNAQEVSLDSGMRKSYKNRLLAWRSQLRMYCRKRNIHFFPIDTRTPWEKVVLYQMRSAGIVN